MCLIYRVFAYILLSKHFFYMSKKKTNDEFIDECIAVHGDKYDYSKVEYNGRNSIIKIICPIHGEFEQIAKLHLSGCGCKKCSYLNRQKKKSLEQFIIDAKIRHCNKYTYEKFEYKNARTKGIITCPKHGDFEQTPNDHLNGKGCPKCNNSHMENDIMLYLNNNNIEYECQKKFDWIGKQSLDFYLPKYNIGIECQGKQHFGKGGWNKECNFNIIYDRDIKKNKLCNDNGVKLYYYINKNDFIENSIYNVDNVFYDLNLIRKLIFDYL